MYPFGLGAVSLLASVRPSAPPNSNISHLTAGRPALGARRLAKVHFHFSPWARGPV